MMTVLANKHVHWGKVKKNNNNKPLINSTFLNNDIFQPLF